MESATEQNYVGRQVSVGVVSNWLSAKEALSKVKQLNCFNEDINSIVSYVSDWHKNDDFFKFNNATYNNFSSKVYSLLNKMNAAIEFCESAGFGEDQHGFDIKMHPTNDFSEFTK